MKEKMNISLILSPVNILILVRVPQYYILAKRKKTMAYSLPNPPQSEPFIHDKSDHKALVSIDPYLDFVNVSPMSIFHQ